MSMNTGQNRKHRNKIHLWSLTFTVIILLLVASVAYADGSTPSLIALISANTEGKTTNGNSTFSSVSYEGLNVAFSSNAKFLNESNVNKYYTDIFLSVDDG